MNHSVPTTSSRPFIRDRVIAMSPETTDASFFPGREFIRVIESRLVPVSWSRVSQLGEIRGNG